MSNHFRRGEEPPPTTDNHSAEPYVSRAFSGRSYTCGDPSCLASGTPEEMFNLSCDPQLLTEARLKEMVRCLTCAQKISRRNQRNLGEPGCGVFPLARTLQRRAEAASRPGPLLYCCEPGCDSCGHPPTMYNTPSDPSKTSLNELVGRVRCAACAEKIVRSRQRRLGEPGCGVYPLAFTMRQAGWKAGTNEDQRLASLSKHLHSLPHVWTTDE